MNKLISDTYLLGKNELLIQVRNPLWLLFGLFQPIVYLILFAPFLTGIAHTPGFPTGNAIQFFAPGLLILNALFNAAFAGFGLIDKLRSGFLERIRVTPVSRLAIVLGFVLRNSVVLIVQSALLLLTALFFGLRIDPVGTLIVAVLMMLIGITMASYAVDAARALLNGTPHDPAVLQAFVLLSVLGVLACGVSSRPCEKPWHETWKRLRLLRRQAFEDGQPGWDDRPRRSIAGKNGHSGMECHRLVQGARVN